MNKNGVLAKKMFDTEHATGIVMLFAPGGIVNTHTTPIDVVFQIMTGAVRVTVGEESAQCEAPTAVVSPKGVPHSLANETAQEAQVLVVKFK